MKYVRIGNDIGIKWYIFRNCAVENLAHANAKVYLFDRNGRQQAFNYTIEDGYIQGTFYGKDQVTTGNYRLVLTENEGNKEMVTLDYIDAFVLSAKLKNMTQSGEDAAIGIKTDVVELSSTISTDKQFADLTDYVKREELDIYAKAVDLQSYALKTELFSKDYNDLTNKPTIPSEYDDTQVRNLIAGKQDKLSEQQIANLNADHSKYLTEHQDLSAYALKTDIPDTSNFATKDEIVPAYDDTQVRNLIAGKQDKLNASQIANLNADHSKYLTEHQTLPDYSNTYANINHTHDQYLTEHQDLSAYAKTVDLQSYALKTDIPDTSSYLTSESDPTVPAYVKSIRQSDIDAWNAATGGVDLSNYVTKNELDAASYITADQVTYPDYSNTYANINHTHDQYLTEHQDLSAYVKTTDLESYAKKTELFSKDYNDLTNKPTIPSEYDDTQVRNLIASKQDKLTESQIANLNADHSKYLTEHQTLPDYSNTYANINHTHDQYLTEHQDLSAYVKTTDLQSYVTKNELDAASYITADQVTYPDYSNTYANINHTHDQYLTEHQDLSAYALKTELFSKDYNDLTNKPTIPSEYDDTQVRNLIAGKQDKLTESQIANLNADHSKYLTEHQTLPDYSTTYAPLEHSHSEYLESESDPTVPAYVKSIKQSDIDAWNAATGGVDLSNYVTKNDLDAASYITADQVTYPDYSNTYANINHTHSQYITEHQDLSAYVKTTDLESYAKKTELFSKDYNDLTNKPTIPSEYDDTQVRNLIASKQDKLTESQIANLNADHSKYLTEHQTLPDYSNTYAPLEHTHSEYLTSESDPTVPAYVKSITEADITNWNTKYDDTAVLSRLDSIEATLGTAYTLSENILNA